MCTLKLSAIAVTAAALALPASANDAANFVASFYSSVDDKALYVASLETSFADDYVDNDRSPVAPLKMSDRNVAFGLFAELRSGFPDAIHTLDILENLGDDRAIVCWTFSSTYTGKFFGAPASGQSIEINGIDVFRVQDGQFVEHWHVEELTSLFQQITPAS